MSVIKREFADRIGGPKQRQPLEAPGGEPIRKMEKSPIRPS